MRTRAKNRKKGFEGMKENSNHENLIEFGASQDKEEGIYILSVIGEIEGHDTVGSSTKATKYEHILPKLAELEIDESVKGILILIHTMGGDVEAGLAIAEMIASMKKPTVSLVLGGSHSIGVPIAVSAEYSYIVPTGTMVIHPVRMSGTVIGSRQTFTYMNQMQNRINSFICSHSKIKENKLSKFITNTDILTKDIGSILTGAQAVEAGLINEVGGIHDAIKKLRKLMNHR